MADADPDERKARWIAVAALSVVAVVVGIVVLAGNRRGGGPGGEGGGGGAGGYGAPEAGSIAIEVAEGSAAKAANARARPVANLAPLRAIEDGQGLVAAGTFEPSGLAAPEGIEVTWPLEVVRPAGESLWIVALDESASRWVATGRTATVDATGKRARGRVFHFSTIGVSKTKPKEEEEPPPGVPHGFSRGVKVDAGGHPVVEVDPKRLEETKKVYERWVKEKGVGSGPMPLEAMKEIYRTGDFATVKTLIEKGVISRDHSTDMADLRILMILETWKKIVKDQKGEIRVHRSDSGNQKAGMSSDVDQTIFVERKKDGAWVRAEDLDATMVERFKTEFERMHRVKVEALDVATIAGRDKFPDWRVTSVQLDAEGKRRFDVHAAETMHALRNTPGAYTYCGAVVQQMQLRVLDAMEKQLRAGEQAPEVKEPREIRVPDLKASEPDFRLNHLLFLTVEPDERGTPKVREAFREDAVRVMFDGLPPTLVAGHAYDAAVANYFEFMHHVGDKWPAVKYHLRALDDGFQMLERLKKGEARFEYANVHEDHRAEHMERIFGESLAKAPPDLHGGTFLSRWKAAFDVSATLRDLHSKKTLNDETGAEAFRPLAEEIAGKEKARWRDFLGAARQEYDRRCQEFMVYNVCETSKERIAEFLSPDADAPERRAILEKAVDEGTLRKNLGLEGRKNDARWKGIREEFLSNYSEQARLQLLYSFRELNATRPDVVDFVLKEAERRGATKEQMALLRGVNEDSKATLFKLWEFAKFPRTYARYAQLAAGAKARALGRSFMEHMSGEYGFVDTPDGPRPTNLLKRLGWTGLHEHVETLMKENRLVGVTDRFLGKTFLNIGAAQSGANVLRAYSESGGDRAELMKALGHELVMMLPVIGQGLASYEAGTDWAQQLMIVVPLFIPELGPVLVVYGIADAGVVLYQNEVLRPLASDVADALYRGYVGPSLADFGREGRPPEFTEADEKRWEDAQTQVKRFASRIRGVDATKGDAQALAIAGRDERLLSAKRSAWKAYLAEQHRYEGSALLGTGRHMKQELVDVPAPTDPMFHDDPIGAPGTLLARIRPVIFYSRSVADGPVDFRSKPLSDAETRRIAELERLLEGDVADPSAWVDAETEHAALVKRRDAYARAQRYLEAAKKNADLMLQIRLDSLWPNLEGEGAAGKGWARDWVAKWVALRRDVLPAALAKHGVETTDSVKPWSKAVLDDLGERLEQDIERSRRLWLVNDVTEKARAKWEAEQVDRKKSLLQAQRLAEVARHPPSRLSEAARAALAAGGVDLTDAAGLSALARTYLDRCVPFSPPAVSIRVRRVPEEGDDAGKGWRFAPDVKVTADPAVYCPPYTAVTYVLDPKSAQEAAGSGRYRGLPLSPDMRASLQTCLAEVGPPRADLDPEKDVFSPAVLTFVFCADVRIPERVVPETVEALPRLEAYDIPLPAVEKMPAPAPADLSALDEDGKPASTASAPRGYLLGGGAYGTEPEKVATGPLRIVLRRMQKNRWNGVEVTSDALKALDPKTPDQGVRFTLLRSKTAGGPFEEVKPRIGLACTADTEVWKPTENEPEPMFYGVTCRRTGKDTVLLQDHVTPDDRDWGHAPVWYRVAAVPILGRENPSVRGKEVTSNAAGPGSPELVLSPWTDNAGRPTLQPNSDGWYAILSARLGLDNEAFDAKSPTYTVSCGSWRGHYWGGGLKVPIPLAGGTISVSAEGEGMSGSATLEIPPDPERQRRAAEAQAAAQKRVAQYDADSERRATGAKERYDAAKRDFEARPAAGSKEPADVLGFVESKCAFVMARSAWRCEVEGEGPRMRLLGRRDVATDAGDWKAACDLWMQEVRVAEAVEPIVKERRAEGEALLARIAGVSVPEGNGDLKSWRDRLRAEVERGLVRGGSLVATSKAGALDGAMWAAWQAGDAGTYEAALAQRRALPATTPAEKEDLAQVLYRAADPVATLSGDGAKAAELLEQAHAIDLELHPEHAESWKKSWESNRPAWWPSK